MRSFGVEEELILVDAQTAAPVAAAPRILASGRAGGDVALEAEIQQEMIEVVGDPCTTADEVTAGIAVGRRHADEAARAVGARAVPLGTSPLAVTPHPNPAPRYAEMMRRYGVTARRSLTCGFHVHVAVDSPEEGVGVLDRIREWLPTLLALTGNSPFWQGVDTGYASYRYDVWSRWPCAGPNPVFGTVDAYRQHEQSLLSTGTLLDAGMLYFDARLSRHHPTVEVRVADICRRAEDAATIALLCRGLVESAALRWRAGEEPIGADVRLIRLATWRAALTGVRGEHVDLSTGRSRGVAGAVEALLRYAEPGLAVSGDGDLVRAGVRSILRRGTGADWQREQFARRGRLEDVVLASTTALPPDAPSPSDRQTRAGAHLAPAAVV